MTTSDIIKKCKMAFLQMRSMEARAKASAKLDSARGSAELELIMDDIQAEGIDPASPLGLACAVKIWQERQREIARANRQTDDRDDFTSGRI